MTGPSDQSRAAAREPCGSADLRDGGDAGQTTGIQAAMVSTEAPPQQAVAPDPAAGRAQGRHGGARREAPAYGALDLGTNNCRLLVARPSRRGFLVIDAFSRIIRLGEGVTASGRLSDIAMARTIEALRICSQKLRKRNVKRSRIIATEACRIAANGPEFVERVREETGLGLEIVSRETEAKLAVSGCASLIDRNCDWALVFDIGGGSSELIWLDLSRRKDGGRRSFHNRMDAQNCIAAWTSLPVGVVTLAEKFGGRDVKHEQFEAMTEYVMNMLAGFEKEHRFRERACGCPVHLLGTSGTVTTIAGINLGLDAYDRRRVDGCWLSTGDVRNVSRSLVDMTYEQRIAQPCVGRDRADLVLAGCAILEALLRIWPCDRLRVADRGLREGILATLMAEDGFPQFGGKRRYGRRGRPHSPH
ncbi:MAG: Ppx/GppA phosphatase family protein [Pseudomonadota bacterium]|nr:Ppx/GppA phosphatase family protein [Pseudomonadota bacterium]